MRSHAFVMYLKPGMAAEYRRRHAAIWPELVQEHLERGIRDYSIFLDEESNTLFAFRKLTNDETTFSMSEDEIVKRWWAYNTDLMNCNADNSPVVRNLHEIFHMD